MESFQAQLRRLEGLEPAPDTRRVPHDLMKAAVAQYRDAASILLAAAEGGPSAELATGRYQELTDGFQTD